MLYRIKDKDAPANEQTAVRDVLELISPVIAELAKVYGQSERGEIDLFREA